MKLTLSMYTFTSKISKQTLLIITQNLVRHTDPGDWRTDLDDTDTDPCNMYTDPGGRYTNPGYGHIFTSDT